MNSLSLFFLFVSRTFKPRPKILENIYPCTKVGGVGAQQKQIRDKDRIAQGVLFDVTNIDINSEGVKYELNDIEAPLLTMDRIFNASSENIKVQCDFVTTSLDKLNLHKHTNQAVKHNPKICSGISHFDTDNQAARDIAPEIKVKEYPCDHCDVVAASRAQLKRHKEIKHEERHYPCVRCSYTATKLDDLAGHISRCHFSSRYRCSQCDFATGFSSRLKMHAKTEHGGMKGQPRIYTGFQPGDCDSQVKTYPCAACDFVADRYHALKLHKKKYHEITTYQCINEYNF